MITINPEMKSNAFYKARKEIARIGKDNNVDLGVASTIWAQRNAKLVGENDRHEWDQLMIQFQRDKTQTLKDLIEG